MNIQTIYQQTILFAARKHIYQTLAGTELPYLVHLCNVAMEVLVAAAQPEQFDTSFAVQVALLHDTLEDTNTTLEELKEHFGDTVAIAVLALTKNEQLPKAAAIPDSVGRIKQLQKEVAIVKLADRITNLQEPDKGDDNEEIKRYQQESKLILQELGFANQFLAARLQEKIEAYSKHITD